MSRDAPTICNITTKRSSAIIPKMLTAMMDLPRLVVRLPDLREPIARATDNALVRKMEPCSPQSKATAVPHMSSASASVRSTSAVPLDCCTIRRSNLAIGPIMLNAECF